VAEYVDTDTPMAEAGEAGEAYLETSGFTRTPPGFQLVVDLDSDGTNDGSLVGGSPGSTATTGDSAPARVSTTAMPPAPATATATRMPARGTRSPTTSS
jgi:hypothetical protein